MGETKILVFPLIYLAREEKANLTDPVQTICNKLTAMPTTAVFFIRKVIIYIVSVYSNPSNSWGGIQNHKPNLIIAIKEN